MRRFVLGLGILTLWWQPASAQPALCPSVDASLTGDAGDLGPTLDIRIRCPRRRAQLPPPPPPPPPPAPRPRVYVVAPPPPPPPPRVAVVQPVFRIGFTLGAFVDNALFEDGALAGAGLHFRLRVDRHWALTASVSTMVSCTKCHESADTSRLDVLSSLGLMYLPFPRMLVAPYIRVAGVVDAVYLEVGSYEEKKIWLAGAEAGAGFEWRILGDLALVADASVLYLAPVGKDWVDMTVDPDNYPAGDWSGIPKVDAEGNVAARLRLGLVYKF